MQQVLSLFFPLIKHHKSHAIKCNKSNKFIDLSSHLEETWKCSFHDNPYLTEAHVTTEWLENGWCSAHKHAFVLNKTQAINSPIDWIIRANIENRIQWIQSKSILRCILFVFFFHLTRFFLDGRSEKHKFLLAPVNAIRISFPRHFLGAQNLSNSFKNLTFYSWNA